MQSRGRSPRTISYWRTQVVRKPRPGGRGSPPLRRVGKVSACNRRRPLSGGRGVGDAAPYGGCVWVGFSEAVRQAGGLGMVSHGAPASRPPPHASNPAGTARAPLVRARRLVGACNPRHPTSGARGVEDAAPYGGLYTLRCGIQCKGTARPPAPPRRLPHFSADSAPYLWYNSLKSRAALGQAHSALRICARKCDLRLLHHSQNREAVLRRQSRRAQAALQLAAMVQCHQARAGCSGGRACGTIAGRASSKALGRYPPGRAGRELTSEREALRRRGKGGPQ